MNVQDYDDLGKSSQMLDKFCYDDVEKLLKLSSKPKMFLFEKLLYLVITFSSKSFRLLKIFY